MQSSIETLASYFGAKWELRASDNLAPFLWAHLEIQPCQDHMPDSNLDQQELNFHVNCLLSWQKTDFQTINKMANRKVSQQTKKKNAF